MAISTAIDAGAVARVTGVETKFVNRRGANAAILPQRLALLGQGASAVTYSLTKAQYTSALDIARVYGFGCPLHLAAVQLFSTNGVGTIPVTVYPLADDVSGVASAGDITPVTTATRAEAYTVVVSNIESEAFVINVGDTVADVTAKITEAINANVNMPVVASDGATVVNLVAKWAGESSNIMTVRVEGATDAGNTFGITQMAGGLINPSLQPALDQFGGVWETMVLNCLNIADTDALQELTDFGEERWSPLIRKPFVAFTGTVTEAVNDAITIPTARREERVNGQLVLPGSEDLTFVVAARQLAKIISLANSNPAHDYGSQRADGLTPGADNIQWDYPARNQAVSGGSSTVEVKDNVVFISDVVTFHHPLGDPEPPYRYLVDIVKLQNVLFNVDLAFNVPEWDGAPLIPDGDTVTNPTAKTPSMAIARAAAVIDGLANEAIIANPASAKAATQAGVNAGNSKRLDLRISVTLSGNTNQKAITLEWSFLRGTPGTNT